MPVAKSSFSVSAVRLASNRSVDRYQHFWNHMIITPSSIPEIVTEAKKIIRYRRRFELIAEHANGNIPWYFLGMIYYREDGLKFTGHIHNGDSLRTRTIQVPKGRPLTNPIAKSGYTFEESAFDLIKLKAYHKVQEWRLETILYYLEANNGFGYVRKGINSPYLWNYTNHYTKGLYVADGKFDKKAVSKQVGCAPLLRYLTDKTLGLV